MHRIVGLRNHHNGEVLVYHCMAQDRHIKAIHSPKVPVADYNYKCSFTIEPQGGDKVALRSCWIGVYLSVARDGTSIVLTDDSTPPKKHESIFHMDVKPNGHIALRGHHGKYISLHHGVPAFKHAGHHTEIWFEAQDTNGSS